MPQPAAQPKRVDPVQVDASHYSVEMENEKVRVLRIRYGPHEKSPMHGHPALIAVLLTDQHSRFTFPDGRTEEMKGKAGQVLQIEACDHAPENLSGQPMELIAIELKF